MLFDFGGDEATQGPQVFDFGTGLGGEGEPPDPGGSVDADNAARSYRRRRFIAVIALFFMVISVG